MDFIRIKTQEYDTLKQEIKEYGQGFIMKIVPVILSGGGLAHAFGYYHARNTPKKYSPQYNLGRYLMYKYNKENLLNQWFLVGSEPCK